ncbi:MAG: bifunctional metallophosphatase/5'-nucleotidase [Syntrophomonadaceae bacterium]|nr:bifunctional metallophosphatase/5'-nucleotidase [Syntrophomonadaceae bacterium]
MSRKGISIGLIALLLIVIVLAAFLPLPGIAVPDQNRQLTILFTHDLHSHFDPNKVVNEQDEVVLLGGLARLAAIIEREKAANPGRVLVVDAGDFSMGTLIHTLFRTEAAEIRLMGKIGYDATTIGNHELDFDSSGLASMLTAAKASGDPLPCLLAANIKVKPDKASQSRLKQALDSFPVEPYTVIEKAGIRIGVFGLLGRSATRDLVWDEDIEVEDQIATARKIVKQLREKEKADLIVCLSHSGTQTEGESEDEILAEEVPEIDFIVSGHTHTTLHQPIIKGNTIIGSAGCFGTHLGILELDCQPGERPSLVSYHLEEVVQELTPVPAIVEEINRYKKIVDREFLAATGYTYDQVLAESDYNLESYDSMRENAVESGLGDLIADSFRAAVMKAEGDSGDYLHLAVQPVGEIRASLTAGYLEVDDVFQVLSLGQGIDKTIGYPLITCYLTGREIKNCLETQSTMAPVSSKYSLQVSGVRFEYNPKRVPFDRVYNILISTPDGGYEPMQPDKLYRVCASYMTAAMLNKMGSISYGIISATPKDKSGRPIRDLTQALVDADPRRSGIQELKEWVTLADYLAAQPDLDGNGIADLPAKYRQPEGRYQAVPSWNPVNLFREATCITWGLLTGLILIISLSLLAVRAITRRMSRSKNARA